MTNNSNTIISYIGDPIENPAEAAFLHKLARDLEGRVAHAEIFANFVVRRSGTRQVNLLVRTPHRLVYVELKSLDPRWPVVGGRNGRWKQVMTGNIDQMWDGNGYIQTRDGIFAVSDVMRAFAAGSSVGGESPFYKYIDGVVCFDPAIPEGSDLEQGDHVSYVGYEQLLGRLTTDSRRRPPWTDDEWEAFARFLRVYREEPESAEERDRRASADEVAEYRARFIASHAEDLHELVPTTLMRGDEEIALDQVRWLVAERHDVVLGGRHGLGKSHVAEHLALDLTREGQLVVWLRAGEYEAGRFGTLLSKSLAPHSSLNATNLLEHAARAGIDVVAVIDGLNECPEELRGEFIEQTTAFRLRNSGGTIATSTRGSGLSGGAIGIDLQLPTPEQREEILRSHGVINTSAVSEAFTTPFELAIAAECLEYLGDAATQAELLDAYVQRFAPSALVRTGLRAIAQVMDSELRTSIRWMDANSTLMAEAGLQMAPESVDAVLSNELLLAESTRVQFRHELFGRFLAAEQCVLESSSAAELGRALVAPHHDDLQRHALVIERSPERRSELLAELADARIYVEAVQGAFGPSISSLVRASIEGALADATFATTTETATFEENGWPGGQWTQTHEWTPNERALLTAAGLLFVHGHFFDEVRALIDETDVQCMKAAIKLEQEGSKRAISAVVAGTYSQGGAQSPGCLGGSIVMYACETDWFRERRGDLVPVARRLLEGGTDRPWGRLYLALETFNSDSVDDRQALASLVHRAWAAGGYHLRLEALHTAFMSARSLDPDQFSEVGGVLDGIKTENVFLSSVLAEGLAAYDLLESSITVEDIHHEVDIVLEDPEDPDRWQIAGSIISRQFENESIFGPYSEAVDSLDPERRRELLIAAAHVRVGMWTSWSFDQLAQLGLTGDAGVDGHIRGVLAGPASAIERDEQQFQEALDTHLAALRAWAVFDQGLPPYGESSGLDEDAWRAIDRLLLNIARGVDDETEVWIELAGPLAPAAVSALCHLGRYEWGGGSKPRSFAQLLERHSNEVRRLFEWGLLHRSELTSWFKFPAERDRDEFMIHTLGTVGDESTVSLLEPLMVDDALAASTVSSIRAIRNREPGR